MDIEQSKPSSPNKEPSSVSKQEQKNDNEKLKTQSPRPPKPPSNETADNKPDQNKKQSQSQKPRNIDSKEKSQKPHSDSKEKASQKSQSQVKQHAHDSSNQSSSSTSGANAAKSSTSQLPTNNIENYKLNLFDHLPKKSPLAATAKLRIEKNAAIHPATVKLGCMYHDGIIRDDDDRVAALIATFCKVIEDYTTPPNQSLSRDLDKHIKAQVQYLVDNRQHCMGMGNLIKYLRSAISSTPHSLAESDAKKRLLLILKQFLEEKIIFARESIMKHCLSITSYDDLILTYGSSPLLRQVLLGISEVKPIRVVVVDSRPLYDGIETLKALSPHIRCMYTNLSGIQAVIKEVSRVLIGASSLLSNGAVLAPAGTAMVAAIAKANNVPVVVVSESFKFSEKVQLDSIVHNELGNISEIAYMSNDTNEPTSQKYSVSSSNYRGSEDSILENTNQKSSNSLPFQITNVRYDITPMNHVSVVATETGLIPPTSIPVLIREFMSAEKLDQEQQINSSYN